MTKRADSVESNRARILEVATRLLITRPVVDITLSQIAEEAKTTIRTLLRVFGSKDALFNEAVANGNERGIAEPVKIGDIEDIVRVLYDFYEDVGPGVIRRIADERRLPALRAQFETGRKGLRQWIERAFDPQLSKKSKPKRENLLLRLLVLADVFVWKNLRQDHGLAPGEARAVLGEMIRAQLKGV